VKPTRFDTGGPAHTKADLGAVDDRSVQKGGVGVEGTSGNSSRRTGHDLWGRRDGGRDRFHQPHTSSKIRALDRRSSPAINSFPPTRDRRGPMPASVAGRIGGKAGVESGWLTAGRFAHERLGVGKGRRCSCGYTGRAGPQAVGSAPRGGGQDTRTKTHRSSADWFTMRSQVAGCAL